MFYNMDPQLDRVRYGDYGSGEQRRYDGAGYDHLSHRSYREEDDNGDIDERKMDRERTRDRERRRERRRREREMEKDREPRDRDSRDVRDSRDRDERTRDREHKRRDDEPSIYDYSHGEGFYEEGGYIDASLKDDYSRTDQERMRERDRHGGQGGNNWMTDTPTNTILLRNLPHNIDETDIKAELMIFGTPIKDVRLMKKKETGASRGFAFVEFQTVTDAQHWMEQNQGRLTLLNKYKCSMYYSMPKNPRPPELMSIDPRADWQRSDWTCSKCGYHNFKRRDHCFKCNIGREDSAKVKDGDGYDQVGNNPCNTLIFRGLDALTTEENIEAALGKVAAHPVKNIKVIRDGATGTSRGFGFAEFSTLAESQQMLMVIQNSPSPFEVDGKAIIVSYAKNTFNTTMATIITSAQQTTTQWAAPLPVAGGQYDYSSYYDQASGQYYDPATGQYYDYSAWYQHQQQQQQQAQTGAVSTTVSKTQTDSTNAAAAVAQAAIQQAQAAKYYNKQHQEALKSPEQAPKSTDENSQEDLDSSVSYAKYPTPDVSTYQFDESSGYYYDPTTGLYYDANSQYYYNSTTGQFMYWDGEKETYLPAPNQENKSGLNIPQTEEQKKEAKKDNKEKKEKVKVAKKIAKDMEKWAKSLNAQKEAFKDFKKSLSSSNQKNDKESASADAGFAILEMVHKSERQNADSVKNEDRQIMPPPILPGSSKTSGPKSGLVAAYGEDSDEDNEDDDGNDEDKLLDYNKQACLLCKRQFPSKEALQRHTQLSDLHKSNLETFRQSKAESSGPSYRDRAKERRAKYGKPSPPVPKKQPASSPNHQVVPAAPPPPGMDTENVGNKLLQKLGWSQGEGLGKSKQGQVDPVETTQRNAQAGLGSRGSNLYTRLPGESYRDAAKKTMFARYQELE